MVVQRRLTDYLGRREDIVDVLDVGRGDFVEVSDLEGGFKVMYVREPELSFSFDGKHSSRLFPLDFGDLKRFYTSNAKYDVTWMCFYEEVSRGNLETFERLLKSLVEKELEHANFNVDVDPQPCHNVVDSMLHFLQSPAKKGSNVVVGGFARGMLREDDYALIKAYSLIHSAPTHIVNERVFERIVMTCKNKYSQKPLSQCGDLRTYLLNNVVQLYAKAGGIPWTASTTDSSKLLRNTVIIGLATAKYDSGYYVGVAFALAYMDREIMSFVTASQFEQGMLNIDVVRSRGLYIPKSVVEEIVGGIVERFRGFGVRRYILFQKPIVHDEELEALYNVMHGAYWILVHVKTSGFAKRVYDASTNDYGSYRGVCIVDKETLELMNRGGAARAILVATGKVRKRLSEGWLVEENLYTATPKPLELEVMTRYTNVDPLHVVVYVSRLMLLLGKLDWEGYRRWPKIPFVLKYAQRVATVLRSLVLSGRKDVAEKVLGVLRGRGGEYLRYVM